MTQQYGIAVNIEREQSSIARKLKRLIAFIAGSNGQRDRNHAAKKMNALNPFILGENWYLRATAPIVSHHIWGIDGGGPTYEESDTFTQPSGWRSCVVLPAGHV